MTWSHENTVKLLKRLLQDRPQCRTATISGEFLGIVAGDLMNDGVESVTVPQIREKIRLLKRTYSDIKKGKRKNSWDHYNEMCAIFDAPIVDDRTEDINRNGTFINFFSSLLNNCCCPGSITFGTILDLSAFHASQVAHSTPVKEPPLANKAPFSSECITSFQQSAA